MFASPDNRPRCRKGQERFVSRTARTAGNEAKTFSLPTFFSIIMISAAVSACGGAAPENGLPLVQTAATTRVVDLSIDPAATGRTPWPDCADQNCSGLRVIDGKAEGLRIDAMRRQGSYIKSTPGLRRMCFEHLCCRRACCRRA
ncbi:hypothetical protein ACHAC9_21620 [Massilia sp. CMS3.1]|uniref:hypothetical protein n=1 Tax=Massilia sp. CMS3.1 TaxID=3373083 RepID=UPI003EE76FEC